MNDEGIADESNNDNKNPNQKAMFVNKFILDC